MDVHQVIDDPALDVPLVLVHDDLLSGIEYLEEAEVGFQVLVERLVLLFVVFDPRFEIFDHLRQSLALFHHFYVLHMYRVTNLIDKTSRLRCSAILPGQKTAIVAAHQLPKLSELGQREVFINEMGHPVVHLKKQVI